MIRDAAYQQQALFEQNLQAFREAGGDKSRLKISTDTKGRTVVTVSPQRSLLLWLVNTFTKWGTRRRLHDQFVATLTNELTPKHLRDRLVKDMRSGVFPFISRWEQTSLISQAESITRLTPEGGQQNRYIPPPRPQPRPQPQVVPPFRDIPPPPPSPYKEPVNDVHPPEDLPPKYDLKDEFEPEPAPEDKELEDFEPQPPPQDEPLDNVIPDNILPEEPPFVEPPPIENEEKLEPKTVPLDAPPVVPDEPLQIKQEEQPLPQIDTENKAVNQPPVAKPTVTPFVTPLREPAPEPELISLADALDSIPREAIQLKRRLPNVGVADISNYLEMLQTIKLAAPQEAERLVDFEEELQAHFSATRQAGLFKAARLSTTVRVLENLRKTDYAAYGEAIQRSTTDIDRNPIRQLKARLMAKASNSISRTGDHVDLITNKDFLLANDLYLINGDLHTLSTISEKLSKDIFPITASDSHKKIAAEIKNLDLEQLERDLLEVEQLWRHLRKTDGNPLPPDQHDAITKTLNAKMQALEPQLKVAARCREEFHRLNSTLGRRWGADVLKNAKYAETLFTRTYSKLEKLEELARPELSALYHAQLAHIKSKHDSMPSHPKVVIEGGGPIGLMQEIKAYEAGADVFLLEKRDAQYNRPQILRLDNQWMKDARYYLGAEFTKLFHPETGIGKIHPDGSGHIVTKALEDALHNRLSALIALENTDKDNPGHIHRQVAHTIDGVEPPKNPGDRYRVTFEYNPRYDPTLTAEQKAQVPKSRESVEADILICAGGNNSPMRNKYFNHTAVTDSKNYGVASWEDPQITNKGQNSFPAIQGVIPITSKFMTRYQHKLNEVMNPISGSLGASLGYEARTELVSLLGFQQEDVADLISKDPLPDTPEFAEENAYRSQLLDDIGAGKLTRKEPNLQSSLSKSKGEVCQIRTFENRNMAYLGMEIPDAMQQWFDRGVNANLSKNTKISKQEREEIHRAVHECWFQSVADHKGISKKLNARMPMMNRKFASTFPVAQQQLSEDYAFVEDKENGARLTIIPIGDAATSPHFMSASGLSGGRETMKLATSYTKSVALSYDTSMKRAALENFSALAKGVSEYVLSKGQDYLKPFTPEEKARQLRRNTELQLTETIKHSLSPSVPYTLARTDETHYRLKSAQANYTLTLTGDGHLISHRDGTPDSSTRSYMTFDHFALENLA